MDALLPYIAGGLLTGIIALVGLTLNQRSQLVRIETVLTGADGTNGLNGDVKQLRKRTHDLADAQHTINGRLQAHDFRLDALEGR